MLQSIVLFCGFVSAAILSLLALAFWRNPEDGLRQTTHRLEKLPLVMADRYTAFAFLALAFTLIGDLRVLAVFFVACAFMGLADGLIYKRAGHPHWKHTISGALSIVALGVTLAAMLETGS